MSQYFCNYYEKVPDGKFKTCQKYCNEYYCPVHKHKFKDSTELADEYKHYCVSYIVSLLNKQDRLIKKEAQAKNIRRIFKFLSENKIFIYQREKFFKTVQNKFTQFEKESEYLQNIMQLKKYKSKIFDQQLPIVKKPKRTEGNKMVVSI
jgi:hypothetical protein